MPYNQNFRGQQRNQQQQGNHVSKDFYNPYSFVGLSNRVCYLNEAEAKELGMAQDVPLMGGLSGKISMRFKALTPFCVRGADGKNAHVDGRYFVPGTTVKGMIRNVFEIMTYSNIRNMVANSRYSMRDLRSQDYTLKTEHPNGGFLIQLNGNFYIQSCPYEPEPYPYYDKKEHNDIDSFATFKKGKNSRDLKEARSVKDKYGVLETPFVEFEDDALGMWFFSGYMNNKKHEFLFEIPELDEKEFLPLEEDEYKDFIFIHEKENENEAWKFWKRRLKNYSSVEEIVNDGYKGIVPCFFRVKDEGNAVRDLGFSFLYRQPYPRTIHDFLPERMKEEGIDMTQAVFGYVNRNDALKGRVHFGNAFIDNPITSDREQTFILGGPEPTYYPFYLKQGNEDKLDTYFSDSAIISGYKRFLVRNEAEEGRVEKSRVTSSFYPIVAGAEFTTTLHFHNLHDYELGALLAAITFNGQTDKCYHSIGYAKPFGYGKLQVVSCEVECSNQIDNLSTDQHQQLLNAFVEMVCKRCDCTIQDWKKDMSPLFAIATGDYVPQKPIRYPRMRDRGHGQNDDEFAAVKTSNYNISDFTPQ